MKNKYLYTSLLTISLLLLFSCSKDYLTIDRHDIVEPEAQFKSEKTILQGLNGVYDMLYPEKNGVGDIQQNWNFKPHMAFSNYPALDCQAQGWDSEFRRHDWRADKDMFEIGWLNCYKGVDRVNRFLANLQKVNPQIFAGGENTKQIITAEARAIRGFFYYYLAQNFGRIPMLVEGETYSNTPNKARAKSVEETWDFVLNDFSFAANILDWKPWKGEYGRVTKGMAKAYVAQVYMYLKKFDLAGKELKEIMDSKTYSLEPSFGSIHTENHWWGRESIFEVAFPEFQDMDWSAANKTDALLWVNHLTAAPSVGGWGALFISDEFVSSFESGDKRKKYSVLVRGEEHPYTKQKMSDDLVVTAEKLPNNYCLKMWKRGLYQKKIYYSYSCVWMRYAAVLLNYAECLFETKGEGSDGDGHSGWYYLDIVRNRAWGNLELAIQPEFPNEPIPLNTAIVNVPLAETFYKNDPHFKTYQADIKKVAVMNERRHEFLAEFSFWYDLVRTGMAQEFLNKEYPKNSGTGTNRQFEFQPFRTIYPIPYLETIRNSAIGPENQNPGY